jgi:hypothetical protein
MENGPFADDFPNKTSIYNGFSIAMLNYQRVKFAVPCDKLVAHFQISSMDRFLRENLHRKANRNQWESMENQWFLVKIFPQKPSESTIIDQEKSPLSLPRFQRSCRKF